tara:strand:- start:112 stop:378 length:267 start_codon:yes stop_codon:yes gene_type:complete
MNFIKYIQTPYFWGLLGLAIGAVFGGNNISVWLVAISLCLFFVNMKLSGPGDNSTEGKLFLGCGVLILLWIVGLSANGIIVSVIDKGA